jgi:hypothetical protein
MKYLNRFLITTCLFFLLAPFAISAQVSLAWEASVTPGVTVYALYSRDYQKAYEYNTPIWQGNATSLSCTVTVPDDRQTAFVVRAGMSGVMDLNGSAATIWSDNSNEVVFIPSGIKPAPPTNLVAKILMAILDFFGPLYG